MRSGCSPPPENAAIVRRGYDALTCGDLTTLGELFGDDISWHTPGRSPLAGDVVGREAVFDLQAWDEFWL